MLLGAQNKLHEILQNGLSSKQKGTPYQKKKRGITLPFTVCI
jgi:hypothetical protein